MSTQSTINREMTLRPEDGACQVVRKPYEAPVIRRKVDVRRVTLFSGDSSSITGTTG